MSRSGEKVELYLNAWYNIFVTAPTLVQEGGVYMEALCSFIVAVAAGVACHYVIKWLDSDE